MSPDLKPELKGYVQAVAAKLRNAGRQAVLANIKGIKAGLAAKVELAIVPDGSLESAMIVESSGNAEFDRAVIQIANAAAPFPPFPEAVRKETDVLNIVRTLRYSPP